MSNKKTKDYYFCMKNIYNDELFGKNNNKKK